MQERIILREEIEQEIDRDPRISGHIDVEVNGRRVRLSGFVNTLEQKELAEAAARKFGPVALESDITIESTKVIDDDDVLSVARKAIAKDPDLAHDIGVDRVVDGVAYLKGHSESVADIQSAAELVAEAPGVRDVISEVKISPGVFIDDVDLVDEVAQALSADPSTHSELIGVTAKNGTVTLDGTVKTLKEKTHAENVAKQMPGVVRIVNEIDVSTHPSSFDEALENEVLKALEISNINMLNARVSVIDGVAYLNGTVDTIKQRDLARKITEAVPGIRYVQNDLTIGFHIEPKAG